MIDHVYCGHPEERSDEGSARVIGVAEQKQIPRPGRPGLGMTFRRLYSIFTVAV